MITHRHIAFWILGGVVVAVALIYFSLSNGVFESLSGPGKDQSIISNQPSVINNQSLPSFDQSSIINNQPSAPTSAVSAPVTSADIPKGTLTLSVTSGAFVPASFTVGAGETVTMAIANPDGRGHTFVFEDPALAHIVATMGPKETRMISFIAPKAGTYTFVSNGPGDTARGTMVVK